MFHIILNTSCSSLQIQLWSSQFIDFLLMKLVVNCESIFLYFHVILFFWKAKNSNHIYKVISYQFIKYDCVLKGYVNTHNAFRLICRPSHDLWKTDESVHVSCNPIVLLCMCPQSNVIQMCFCYYTSIVSFITLIIDMTHENFFSL